MDHATEGAGPQGIDRLERITTEYVEVEDRIRIAGTAGGRQPVVLWLTQRLARRLLPPLCEWLSRREGDPLRAEVLQGFAQQRALAAMEPQAPVRPVRTSRHWRVASIDVTRGEDAVQLTFKGDLPDDAVRLTMSPMHARQWLAILHAGFRKGGWPLDGWPEWIAENNGRTEQRPAPVVLH